MSCHLWNFALKSFTESKKTPQQQQDVLKGVENDAAEGTESFTETISHQPFTSYDGYKLYVIWLPVDVSKKDH